MVDNYDVNKKNRKTEYMDNADRVEVERSFSLAKRCYGLGRIMTKLDGYHEEFYSVVHPADADPVISSKYEYDQIAFEWSECFYPAEIFERRYKNYPITSPHRRMLSARWTDRSTHSTSRRD